MTFHAIFKIDGKNQIILKFQDFIGNLLYFEMSHYLPFRFQQKRLNINHITQKLPEQMG